MSDRGYFAARAMEERRLAAEAENPKVRSIHLTLADAYQRRSAEAEEPSDEARQAADADH